MNPPRTSIRIDRLALDGDGIGRLAGEGADAGKVAFVPYSLPGETIECRSLIQKKNLSRWIPLRVEQASPNRVTPPCPYHFRPGGPPAWCGGCDWQQMPIEAQRRSKTALLAETLVRMGGIPNPPMQPLIESPTEWRYRNKVQVPFGRRGDRVVAGFFAPGSHQIVEFEDCLVQPELSVRIVRFVRDVAQEWGWPIYDEDMHRGWLRHLLVRTNAAGEAVVALVTAKEPFRDKEKFITRLRAAFPKKVIGLHQNIQPARTNVILGREWIHLGGARRVEEPMLGLKLSYSVGAFFQINTGAAERLYAKAIEELEPARDETVIDVYCGVGAMTLLAARKAGRAIGIESVPEAIRDAERNAHDNNLRNVQFVVADAARAFGSRGGVADRIGRGGASVIVDPPRSGCEPPVIDALLRLAPRRIVYVSCHPATLARDIKLLSPRYRLSSVTPVDLFPQTAHIETVARLDRL